MYFYVTVRYFMDETTNIFKFQGQKLNLDNYKIQTILLVGNVSNIFGF